MVIKITKKNGIRLHHVLLRGVDLNSKLAKVLGTARALLVGVKVLQMIFS